MSPHRVVVGTTITVAGPAGSFAPFTTVTLRMVRVVAGASPITLGTFTANANGSLSGFATVPSGTATGVYFIYAEGNGPAGNTKVLITTLVVSRPAGSAQAERGENAETSERQPAAATDGPLVSPGIGGPVIAVPGLGSGPTGGSGSPTPAPETGRPSASRASSAPVLVPPVVAALQGTLTPAQEAAAVKDVTAGDAKVVLDEDGGLKVAKVAGGAASSSSSNGDGGSGAPAWAAGALALALAGGGLLTLRNRKNARKAA